MDYFFQDMLYCLISLSSLFCLAGYMIYRRHFPRGGLLLLGLILLLSTAGLSDLVFRVNPHPSIVLFSDSLNVFCYAFALVILLHYSLAYSSQKEVWTEIRSCLVLYLPALVLSSCYALSPFMISGIVSGSIGFQLSYNPGYWVIVIYGIFFSLSCIYLNLGHLGREKPPAEINRAIFLLFTLLLLAYFYNASLILPFLFRTVNFASPLPTSFAVMILAYAYIKYNYFSLENNFEEKAPQP
jgi:hypothetical protein